ncbi:MAG: helix-turn-helix transcriptional regulator [Bacteroidota bacterium]
MIIAPTSAQSGSNRMLGGVIVGLCQVEQQYYLEDPSFPCCSHTCIFLKFFNKTLSNLITDRIILEAKRELYLTLKPVKAIAYDLGFTDEFHFSRYFKKNVNISPQTFRDTVGSGKALAG